MDFERMVNGLKRSSSAPMIHEAQAPPHHPPPLVPTLRQEPRFLQSRVRRFSASFSPLSSPGSGARTPCRVSQLKQEEGMDERGKEAAGEKLLHSALRMSQSWEDLSLAENLEGSKSGRKSLTDPLHLNIGSSGWSSGGGSGQSSPSQRMPPAAAAIGVGQRPLSYSPAPYYPIRSINFSPSSSPSPTRKSFTPGRRSLSPISLRPSQFPSSGVKRKSEAESPLGLGATPPKRVLAGGLLIPQSHHTLLNSLSSSSTLSPAGQSVSSESTSSLDSPSPGCAFRPVSAESADVHMADSGDSAVHMADSGDSTGTADPCFQVMDSQSQSPQNSDVRL